MNGNEKNHNSGPVEYGSIRRPIWYESDETPKSKKAAAMILIATRALAKIKNAIKVTITPIAGRYHFDGSSMRTNPVSKMKTTLKAVTSLPLRARSSFADWSNSELFVCVSVICPSITFVE